MQLYVISEGRFATVRAVPVHAVREVDVSDMKESLVMMRDMAKSRIQMLKEGVTYHSDDKASLYLAQYEAKVRELDQLIRRMSLSLVRH